MINTKKIIKFFYDYLIKIILNQLVINFINKKKILELNKVVCVPSVNTTGDALIYYDFVKLKLKNPLVISTKNFPSDKLLPFYFKKKEFLFFENKFHSFLLNLNSYNRMNLNHFTLEILEKKLNEFKYYIKYDKDFDTVKERYKTQEYIKLRTKDNKFLSLKLHCDLKSKKKFLFNKLNGYSNKHENELLSYFKLKKKKFVCVHIRPYPKFGPYAYNKQLETNPRSVSQINNYNLGFKYLLKLGIKIILMGRKDDNLDINFKDKHLIHYYKSNKQNIINDLYLVQNCSFFIGTQSGPGVIPSIMNKPTLHTNYVSFFGIFPSKYSLYLPKKYLKKNKILTLKKYFNSKYFFMENSSDFNSNGILLSDNSESEILNSIKELIKNMKKKYIHSTSRQGEFIKSLKKHNLLSFDNKIIISDDYLKKYLN